MKIIVAVKGGSGSGNYGHVGRPGLVGGSGGEGIAAIEHHPDAYELEEALKRDRKMTFHLGEWKKYGEDDKTYTLQVGDNAYALTASSIIGYTTYGRGKLDASKTSSSARVTLSVSVGKGLPRQVTLYKKSVAGESGDARTRFAGAKQGAINYMRNRFGIDVKL